MTKLRFMFSAAALLCMSAGAYAQTPTSPSYNVQEMNFDMWCQEQQHLSPARCDKRLPADDAAFQVYRAKIESYEIPYLQRKNNDQQINTGIIHYDPVDHNNPSEPNPTPDHPTTPPGG